MSKGSVWNKGKHNGGASRVDRSKMQAKPIEPVLLENSDGFSKEPLNSVKRMDRKNWVERAVRVDPKK